MKEETDKAKSEIEKTKEQVKAATERPAPKLVSAGNALLLNFPI